eukprot:CAMPEP_0195542992 /NCGR_PEP_ID=MMETSP0794_2-20130614/51888_1 /TAXON_ID=515487 /ORGANISM="Stephanopyxis turris, Strain CCMP 815" /LENGTH=191 /DNA_ID=CAMNT_0040677139 /DNA_START=292 /DNA_END=867 /DNA_ORIENTATION=+
MLFCHRWWTVDPKKILANAPIKGQNIDFLAAFRAMVAAEGKHQSALDELQQLNLRSWLERHFIGQFAPHWNGWERRFWSWDPARNVIYAWLNENQLQCMASFQLGSECEVRRVDPEEQIELSRAKGGLNPITVATAKQFVFTITNTTFDMLFACDSEKHLQQWIDKISVHLHPLKSGKKYKAPAKYSLAKI